jgi:hypothetical protein
MLRFLPRCLWLLRTDNVYHQLEAQTSMLIVEDEAQAEYPIWLIRG